MSKREEVLSDAIEIVTQDRNREYGGPEDSFGLIADYWTILFGIPVTATKVALAMDLLKTARLQSNPAHRDSWVDKAGYSACGYEVSAVDMPVPTIEKPGMDIVQRVEKRRARAEAKVAE